jgi:ribonuclease Z
MELTMLGTGNAMVTECYNTCFVLRDNDQCFLVDGGGGSTLLRQLKRGGIDWRDVRTIFVTHKHIDHILGIIWMMRMICQHMNQGEYEGEATIYAHDEVIALLRDFAEKLLKKKETNFIDKRLHLVTVADGDSAEIFGRKVTFFDIQSTKAKQFGFSMELDNDEKLTCCGDEPYNPCERVYAEGSTWLLHEAFCLAGQAEVFHPYEKHHSTVKDASQLAQELGVKNLLLYHTEDSDLPHRKARYTAEGKQYFSGNIFVPDDLEKISL